MAPAAGELEKIGAFALTKPDHGSDFVGLATGARADRDGWVIDGAKRWIGNGSIADVVIVWATDDDEDVGGFVVEREAVDAIRSTDRRVPARSGQALPQAGRHRKRRRTRRSQLSMAAPLGRAGDRALQHQRGEVGGRAGLDGG